MKLGEAADEYVGEFFLCLGILRQVMGLGVLAGGTVFLEFFEYASEGFVVQGVLGGLATEYGGVVGLAGKVVDAGEVIVHPLGTELEGLSFDSATAGAE